MRLKQQKSDRDSNPHSSQHQETGTLPVWDRVRLEVRETVHLALPLVFAALAFKTMLATDMVMMGWLGAQSLAAGALANYIYFPVYILAAGIVTAVAPLAAQAIGARRFRVVRRTVRQGLWIAFLLSSLGALALLNGEAFLIAIDQDTVVAALSGHYLKAAAWALIPGIGFAVLQFFLSALGRPQAVFFIACGGIVMNGFTNYVLMYGKFGLPTLGLTGIGLSTSLVNTALFLGLAVYVIVTPPFRRYALFARFWRPDWPRFIEIFKLGAPVGCARTAELCFFCGAGLMMGWLGVVETAAYAIAFQYASIAFMVPLGLSQAAEVRVGWAAGVGNAQGVTYAGWVALGIICVYAFIPAILFWLVPIPLIDLFLDIEAPENASLIPLSVSYLIIAGLFQWVDGLQAVGASVLRGLKDTRTPSLVAILSYWVIGFPACYLLTFKYGFGGMGVWIGFAIGLTIAAALLLWRFYRRETFWQPIVESSL